MNIFNSLGSNYNFAFAVRVRFAKNDFKDIQDLTHFLGKEYAGKAYLTYKGRDALYFALCATKLPKGSKVAINGFTCFAVYKAIKDAELIPVLLDIDENTLHFSAHKIPIDVKVVIIQNTLGIPCDVEGISAFCKKNNILLIEDLAHSVGIAYANQKKGGRVGDFIIFSFSQDKMIDTVSGGALIIRNKKYQDFSMPNLKKQSLWRRFKDRTYPTRTWEIRTLYSAKIGKLLHSFFWILNVLPKPIESGIDRYEMSSWQAKLALEQFKKLEKVIKHRQKIAQIYSKKHARRMVKGSVYLRFPLMTEKRQELIAFLKTKGVYISDIWYDAPISPKRYMNQIIYNGECPISEQISKKIINLPTHINVSEDDARQISNFISDWNSQGSKLNNPQG